MNTKRIGSIFALMAAGVVGGVVSRFITPQPALAQDQPSTTKEIRVQSVVLVDPSDNPVGTLTTEAVLARWVSKDSKGKSVSRVIVLRGPDGQVLWRPDGDGVKFRTLN